MSITRRGFLGGVAAGSGLLIGDSARAAGPKRFPGYSGRYGLLHDTTLCVGCRACEVACAQVNKRPRPKAPVNDQAIFRKMRRVTDKLYTVVNRYLPARGETPAVYRKHQCMHCNEPCCASVCFVQAFKKTPEGPVLYDPDVCVGCRYCVMACPYYALAYEYDDPLTPRVVRCTMCYDRIKKGRQPGCAEACPMGAITFGRRKDLLEVARARIKKYPERYVNHIFGEHEFGGTSWLTLSGVAFSRLGLEENLPHKPLPEFISGFLGVVPLVITIYPGLLLGFYAWSKRKERLAEQARAEAVAQVQAQAEAETKKKLEDAAKAAQTKQEKAVAAAVKKALEEAKATADKEDSP